MCWSLRDWMAVGWRFRVGKKPRNSTVRERGRGVAERGGQESVVRVMEVEVGEEVRWVVKRGR